LQDPQLDHHPDHPHYRPPTRVFSRADCGIPAPPVGLRTIKATYRPESHAYQAQPNEKAQDIPEINKALLPVHSCSFTSRLYKNVCLIRKKRPSQLFSSPVRRVMKKNYSTYTIADEMPAWPWLIIKNRGNNFSSGNLIQPSWHAISLGQHFIDEFDPLSRAAKFKGKYLPTFHVDF